jgi:hypothetical protein
LYGHGSSRVAVYRVRVIDVLISPAIGTPAPKIMLLSFRFSGVLSS